MGIEAGEVEKVLLVGRECRTKVLDPVLSGNHKRILFSAL